MKINLSEVMVKAWEIKKENILNVFSECLKMAWAIAKKTVKKVVTCYKITNDITLNTIKKISREHYYSENIQEKGLMNQTSENLDNGFITEEALDYIIDRVFETKKGGSFLNSTKSMFGNRGRCRFIKDCIVKIKDESNKVYGVA